MLRKIYVCGVHSSGKTTLVNNLKVRFQINENVIFHSELARKIIQENGITPKEQDEDLELFKKLNCMIIKEQIKLENKVEEWNKTLNQGEGSYTLSIFDRGILDPVVYLYMRIGENFGNSLLSRPDISKIVESLRSEDTLVFVTKPFLEYFQFDGVRLESFDFNSCIAYDEEMRNMMNRLKIPFVYISMEDLQERTDFVVNELLQRWPELKRLC